MFEFGPSTNVVIAKIYAPNPPIEARRPGPGAGEPPPIPPEPAAHTDKPAAVTEADIPRLVKELADSRKRKNAVFALTKIGKPALPALIETIRGKDRRLHEPAIEVLFEIDRDVVPSLVKAGKPAVPALIEALRGEDDRLHQPAAEALGKIGPEAAEAIGPLMRAVLDSQEREAGEEPAHRRDFVTARKALLKVGMHTPKAVPILVKLIDDDDRSIRLWAVGALGEIGPDAKAAVPELVKRLNASHSGELGYLAGALGKIGPAAGEAAPALVRLAFDGEALAKIGKPAVPWIKRCFKTRSG